MAFGSGDVSLVFGIAVLSGGDDLTKLVFGERRPRQRSAARVEAPAVRDVNSTPPGSPAAGDLLQDADGFRRTARGGQKLRNSR
jgi:hypothetical protein